MFFLHRNRVMVSIKEIGRTGPYLNLRPASAADARQSPLLWQDFLALHPQAILPDVAQIPESYWPHDVTEIFVAGPRQ